MSALIPFFRVRREDLPTDAPKWVDKIIVPFNNAIEAIYLLLNRSIKYQDNIRCVIKDVSTRPEKMPIEIVWPYQDAPIGVIILSAKCRAVAYATDAVPVGPDWHWGEGRVVITAMANMSRAELYDFKLMVI